MCRLTRAGRPRAGASHRFGRPLQRRGRKVGPANIRLASRLDCVPGRDKSGGSGELKRQLAAGGHAEGRAVAGCRVGTIAIVAARPCHPGHGTRRRQRGAAVGHHVCRHHHIETGHRRRDTRQQHGKCQQRRQPVTAAGNRPASRAIKASFHGIRLAQTFLMMSSQNRAARTRQTLPSQQTLEKKGRHAPVHYRCYGRPKRGSVRAIGTNPGNNSTARSHARMAG